MIAVNGSHPLDLDEWVRFREKFPDIVILGASPFVNGELESGTPADVEAEVREKAAVLAPGGGWLLGSSNSIPDFVPVENYRALLDSGLKHGKYSLS